MTAKLRRCRVVWGETERIEAPPRLRSLADATYLPLQPDGSWGLFGPDGAVIEGSGPDPVSVEAGGDAPDAPYLYVGPLVTHYGHFLLSGVARLWPLLAWEGPPPRLLGHGLGPDADWRGLEVASDILARFGLTLDDVATFAAPTRIRRVVVPDPSLKEQAFAHAIHGDLARFIGRPFWDEARVDGEPRPIYLSKARLTTGISRMRNEGALCAALERRGVDVAFPEELPFADKTRLLAERRIILGSTSSAFHITAFSAPGRRIVGLNWAPHLNANFPLIDDLNGNVARYYHPVGAASGPAAGFHFEWEAPDPDGLAAELVERAAMIDGLDARDEAEEAALRRASRGPPLTRLGRWLTGRGREKGAG